MNIESMFRPLADMERRLSHLYGRFSETFAADPELGFVFFKMSAEEKGHASLVEYQRRMVQKNPELLLDSLGGEDSMHVTRLENSRRREGSTSPPEWLGSNLG